MTTDYSNTFVRWSYRNVIKHGIEVFELVDLWTGATYEFLSDFGRELKKQQIEQKERREGKI